MDAIATFCSAKLRLAGVASGCCGGHGDGNLLLPVKELSFSRSLKAFSFRVTCPAPEKFIGPLRSLSNADAGLGLAEDEIEEAYPPKTARVRFHLKKECLFGEQFFLVGDDPMFGSWDPSGALPMNWSDGNVWTIEVHIPVGREIHFKFLLKGTSGGIQWQPDPDRALKIWETDDTITVHEDWEDSTLQRIIEGETLDGSSGQLIADNLSPPMDEVIHETDNGSVLVDTVSSLAETPVKESDEKDMAETRSPMQIVAENISPSPENLDTADDIQQERISPEAKYEQMLDKDTGKSKDSPNNRKDIATKSTSTSTDGNLVAFDEGPILVPGLTPVSMALAKEAVQHESKRSDAADVIAKDPKVPEFPVKDSSSKGSSNYEEVSKEEQEEVPGKDNVEDEESVDRPDTHGVLRNDIQWGRRTLQNFLANLGLLS